MRPISQRRQSEIREYQRRSLKAQLDAKPAPDDRLTGIVDEVLRPLIGGLRQNGVLSEFVCDNHWAMIREIMGERDDG